MTSPAESYAEHRAAERSARRAKAVRRQLDHLQRMISDCGFGRSSADSWTEREIERHLTAAFELLHHELRASPVMGGGE